MTGENDHKALLVGDETKVKNFLAPALELIPLGIVFSHSGEAALEQIKSADTPFSLVISDQRLSGMEGTVFLQQAKILSPDTVRLLLTRYSDMETIKDSVNRGAVHRYVLKTKGDQDSVDAIKTALNQYEIQLETKAQLKKAKALNKQLYKLDCELIDSTKSLDQAHADIDQEIAGLEAQITEASEEIGLDQDQAIGQVETALEETQGITAAEIDRFFSHAVKQVFAEFGEAAKRSGFQMLSPKSEDGA